MNLYDIANNESRKRRGNMIDIPVLKMEPVVEEQNLGAHVEQPMQMLGKLNAKATKPKSLTPFQERVQTVVNQKVEAANQEKQQLTPIRQSFLKVLAHEENSVRAGWKNDSGVWHPHKSLEGGTGTLAYGHKLTEEEASTGKVYIGGKAYSIKEGISEDLAQQLLEQDFEKSFRRAKKTFGDVWEHLDPRVKMLAAEINFNTTKGLEGFPRFQNLAKGVDNPDETLTEIGRGYTDAKSGEFTQLTGRVNALKSWYKNYKEE